MSEKLKQAFLVTSLGFLTAGFVFGGESNGTTARNKRSARAQAAVEIKILPVGTTQETIDQTKAAVERSTVMQSQLRETNYRIVNFESIERGDSKATVGRFNPEEFRITFYDYTNDRTLIAEGAYADPQNVRVIEDANKPFPSEDEIEAATEIVSRNEQFAAALKNQRLRVFQAMPPITIDEKTGERLVNIGLESLDSSTHNEVVSVSFKHGEVIRYSNNAPPTSSATASACGIPSSGGGSTANGTPGQYQMTVSQDGTTLWEFLVIRPSASSGNSNERSGIELRDLRYRGKMVLKRAHAPVLNVQYVNGTCGPYRDWQYSEGDFDAPATGATDPAPGIRLLAAGQIAKTALDSGVDAGNFKGVAVYTQDNETVLVTEMNAGWYRYLMEWRLGNDGTIRPRYGFAATNNSCVCAVHVHHVYWRFDFDIVNANNRIFQVERGRKFLTPILTEAKFYRREQTNRSLLIQNGSGDEAYLFVPNLTDGKADAYGDSDFWVLHYRDNGGQPGELDDPNTSTAINLNPWINGESLDNEDLVVWYGSHFIHSDGANIVSPDRTGRTVLSGSHVVGPDIRPVRW